MTENLLYFIYYMPIPAKTTSLDTPDGVYFYKNTAELLNYAAPKVLHFHRAPAGWIVDVYYTLLIPLLALPVLSVLLIFNGWLKKPNYNYAERKVFLSDLTCATLKQINLMIEKYRIQSKQ